MAVVDLFGAVGGRPEIDPSAASRGYELGTKAGAMSGQTGRLAFLNEMINKRDQRRATEASMAQEQTKARVAKIQDILIRGADPNANPVDRAAAEKIKVMLDSNPQMAQVIGIDPSKSGGGLDVNSLLTNSESGEPSQTSTFDILKKIQEKLPEGVSTKQGDFNITGSKVGEGQKKNIAEIQGTSSVIDRVVEQSINTPDLGNINKGFVGLLPPGREGPTRSFLSEKFSAGKGGYGTGLTSEQDENFRTYISNLDTNGGSVYKALSGDSGRLSDFDIERGKNLMWRPDKGESIGIRDKKNAILKAAVAERERAIRQGDYYIDPETGAIMTPQIIDKALNNIDSIKEESNSDVLKNLGLDPDKVELIGEE